MPKAILELEMPDDKFDANKWDDEWGYDKDCPYYKAAAHGFWDEEREVGTLLMLIVSELGEALEAHRNDDMENFAEELADVAIRLADLCGGLEIDLEKAILAKMDKNSKRPYLHGKAY